MKRNKYDHWLFYGILALPLLFVLFTSLKNATFDLNTNINNLINVYKFEPLYNIISNAVLTMFSLESINSMVQLTISFTSFIFVYYLVWICLKIFIFIPKLFIDKLGGL